MYLAILSRDSVGDGLEDGDLVMHLIAKCYLLAKYFHHQLCLKSCEPVSLPF